MDPLVVADYVKIIKLMAGTAGLTPAGIDYATSVVSSPPSREPQNARGRNQIVDFASRKMGHTMAVESIALEAAFAEAKEHDSICLGYWAQPQSIFVPIRCSDGIVRKIALTPDFAVLQRDRFLLVECKPWDKAQKISQERPEFFKFDPTSGRWVSPEIEREMPTYGFAFQIVTERDLPTKLIRNYSLLDEVRNLEYSSPLALPQIESILAPEKQGISIAALIAAGGSIYEKNDVFIAILKHDVHVLLSDCLLADHKIIRADSRHTSDLNWVYLSQN